MDKEDWRGVFPAATTQFGPDLALDLEATSRVQAALLDEGVDGLVVVGTVGENNSLEPDEKRAVIRAAVAAAGGRAPVIAGVSELTTARAAAFARDAEAIGADGLMLLPAMVYVPTPEELYVHFKTVAGATGLPIMLYNNPPAYRVQIDLEVLDRLAGVANIVAVKESAPDPRRITDLVNRFGARFQILAGLDDVALEAMMLGACGWVSGLTNVFPAESVALARHAAAGDFRHALPIYRWLMPLLHLDAAHDLVQSIKLAEALTGRGSERVRPPRLPLAGARRAEVIAMVERATATRPAL